MYVPSTVKSWLSQAGDKTPAASEKNPDEMPNFVVGLVHLFGVFTFVVCMIGAVVEFNKRMDREPSNYRNFSENNADGVTANAAEEIRDHARHSTPFFGYALAAMIIVVVERMRATVQQQNAILWRATHKKKADPPTEPRQR